MGSIVSILTSPRLPLLQDSNGNSMDYHDHYREGPLLGEGQFGRVKEAYPQCDSISPNNRPYKLAVKKLQKGMTFRKNIIYTRLRPEILQRECHVLRSLQGTNYTMKLEAIYESPTMIYMITESYDGGHLLEWIKDHPSRLTEIDISRLSYQLLTAIHHCSNHGVIHRDIKAENLMFVHPRMDSDLRLIDFGSCAWHADGNGDDDDDDDDVSSTMITKKETHMLHTTMAGTPFYTSPEMFQRKYSYETDVWSVGVVLYVLVAGYPKDELQSAFDILHTRTNRNLKHLPNLPPHLPDAFLELLNDLLTYKRIDRGMACHYIDREFLHTAKLVSRRGN